MIKIKKICKIMALLLIIAAVIFATGCAEKTETTGNETQGDSGQVSSETPETPDIAGENVTETDVIQDNETENAETGQVVTEADNGTSISLKKGETFTLQLEENPSTGYSWEINVSEGLSILSDGYTQDEAPENDNGEVAVGVPGTHSWIIEAVDQGSQQVNGIYKRSWENTTGTEDNFTLAVEVE